MPWLIALVWAYMKVEVIAATGTRNGDTESAQLKDGGESLESPAAG